MVRFFILNTFYSRCLSSLSKCIKKWSFNAWKMEIHVSFQYRFITRSFHNKSIPRPVTRFHLWFPSRVRYATRYVRSYLFLYLNYFDNIFYNKLLVLNSFSVFFEHQVGRTKMILSICEWNCSQKNKLFGTLLFSSRLL